MGWKEQREGGHGRNYFYNIVLGICTWEMRAPHGEAVSQVGMIVETNEEIQCNLAEHGYEGALQKGTQIEILYVGEKDDEAGYLYGEICATKTTKPQFWLSFTCIREAGCQSSRQLPHASQIPEVCTPGSQTSLTIDPSTFDQRRGCRIILADSTLLLFGEMHVCVNDDRGQALGDIVGNYGGFVSGTFGGVIQQFIIEIIRRFGTPGERLQVAYVHLSLIHI